MPRDIITVLLAEQQISEHITKSSRPLSAWYVGIAEDPEERLFKEHSVPRENYWWIYRDIGTKKSAEEVEKFFIDKGAKGAPGGGTDKTVFVYAYLTSQVTRESA